MNRHHDEPSPEGLELLVATLATRCGLLSNDPVDNLQSNADSNSSQLPLDRLNLMKAVASELIQEQGSVEACLQSLAVRHDQDTQRGALSTNRESKSTETGNLDRKEENKGRFEVQRFLAKGGIGQVSVAIDKQLNREVAFKEIRPDRTSDQRSRGRFVVEAEVTGRLEHPGVVPVYSLGSSDDGLPFYAMRFIRGESLSHAIRKYHSNGERKESLQGEQEKRADEPNRQIQFRKLLQNFVSVCNTMHYAHDRGVVHRDIKPDNIMIGSFGETLVVDWGIAKTGVAQGSPSDVDPAKNGDDRLIPKLTAGRTTRQGDVMGTPGYMSPEQILGWQDRINSCSDVYSLGATLYTLLTGKPPFHSANFDQLSQQVLEGAVESPRQLNSEIPPALEAITLKAMSPKQSLRYATSVDLANDIEAWLADEPTSAYRDPLWQRVKRWLKRHPAIASGSVATIALTLVGLIAGLAIVGGFNQKLEKSNNELALSNQQVLAEKNRAENNFGIAQSAVDQYLTQVSADPTLSSPAFLNIRTSLLKTAIPFYEDFLEQNPDDQKLATSRGKAMIQLGNIWQLSSENEKAISNFEQAIDLFEGLSLDPNLSDDESDLNQLELLSCWLDIGSAQFGIGKPKVAIASTMKSLSLLESMLASERFKGLDPSAIIDENKTDDSASETEQLDSGEVEGIESVDGLLVLQNLITLRKANCHSNLGAYHFSINQFDQSEEHSKKAVELMRHLEKTPANQHRLAASLNNLGVMANSREEWRPAWEYLDESFHIGSELIVDYPGATDYRAQLAKTLHNVAKTFQGWNLNKDSIANFEAALVHERWLATNYPAIPAFRSSLAITLNDYANMLIRNGELERPLPMLEEAIAIAKVLSTEQPDVPEYKVKHAHTISSLGLLNMESKKWDAAESHFLESRVIWKALFSSSPEQTYYAFCQSRCELNLGINQQEQGNFEEALEWFQKSNLTLDTASSSQPANFRVVRMSVYWGIAESNEGLGQFQLAAEAWNKAIEFAPNETEKHIRRMRLAMALANAGSIEELNTVSQRLAEFPNPMPETHYRIARAFAICASNLDRESDEFQDAAKRCLKALTEARNLGQFKEPTASKRFNEDDVFEVFESLEEFQQFMGKL